MTTCREQCASDQEQFRRCELFASGIEGKIGHCTTYIQGAHRVCGSWDDNAMFDTHFLQECGDYGKRMHIEVTITFFINLHFHGIMRRCNGLS